MLSSIGSRSTGTKSIMVEQLLHDSKIRKLVFGSSTSDSKSGAGLAGLKPSPGLNVSSDVALPHASMKATTRVLSIDMGIKNLAFCVCDVPALSKTRTTSSKENDKKQKNEQIESTLRLSVVAWKRIAVTGSTTPTGRKKKVPPKDEDDGENKKPACAFVEGDDPFSPMQLSKTAYKLVREVLLPYSPDTILIERQRFRSGGGSAVQEWTVRVNMFESMIWAILTTLKNEGIATQTKTKSKEERVKVGGDGKPQIWHVSPMRVASFWIGKEAKKLALPNVDIRDKKKGRVKVEKKEKVDLVQRWILSDAGGIEVNEAVEITFQDEAVRTRNAFMAEKSGPNRKPKELRKIKEPKMKKVAKMVVVPVVELLETPGVPAKESLQEEPLLDIGKLDDLADCLLQAGAWTKWEMNRLVLHEMIEEEDIERVNKWIRDKDY